ncbi:MAG: hypothetical protein ACYC61_02865 [Isosphaeraceae bacterium]
MLELPAPDPWAPAEPVLVGEVAVFEPVCVVAAPVLGVEPVEEPPAWALDVLPVEADADEPPVAPEVAEVEVFVEVEALADPPVAVEVGVGAGVGVGVGLAVRIGEGVGVGLADVGVGLAGVAVELAGGGASVAGHDCPSDLVEVPVQPLLGVGRGLFVLSAVGTGEGVGVCVALVELVVELVVVVVLDDPPLIDGFTLNIGLTVMFGL